MREDIELIELELVDYESPSIAEAGQKVDDDYHGFLGFIKISIDYFYLHIFCQEFKKAKREKIAIHQWRGKRLLLIARFIMMHKRVCKLHFGDKLQCYHECGCFKEY